MVLTTDHLERIKEVLESILGSTADLGKRSPRSLIYAKAVIANGQKICTTNRFESERFMATCLSIYAELQQQRKEILHAYTT